MPRSDLPCRTYSKAGRPAAIKCTPDFANGNRERGDFALIGLSAAKFGFDPRVSLAQRRTSGRLEC